ncbi:MAG: glycoside hydrolase family 16 protein [Myxococcota bacterium]
MSAALALLPLAGCGHVTSGELGGASASVTDDVSASPASAPELDGWVLTWSDEFEGPQGTLPDPSKWQHDLGGEGWGNAELQHYTDRAENASLDGEGHLRIVAREEAYEGNAYTSGRLKTQGLFQQTYGRFEARIQTPVGQGVWPAFWMLGANITTVGWPACGEIDIMEFLGHDPLTTYGSLHGPGFSGGDAIGERFQRTDGAGFHEGFHTFTVTWDPTRIVFEVDGEPFHTAKIQSFPPEGWVFNQDFFLILNVAVGGHWPGYPDETTAFPTAMLVDYVRVWERVE